MILSDMLTVQHYSLYTDFDQSLFRVKSAGSRVYQLASCLYYSLAPAPN